MIIMADNIIKRSIVQNIYNKMSAALVSYCMVFPLVLGDNSVSQQALPDDLTLSVLLIVKGSCFHVL